MSNTELETIFIKIGTDAIISNPNLLHDVASDVARLKEIGHRVIIISSGAVGLGRDVITDSDDLARITSYDPVRQKQIFAGHGQVELMNNWRDAFAEYGVEVDQVLATKNDLRRPHFLTVGVQNVVRMAARIFLGTAFKMATRETCGSARVKSALDLKSSVMILNENDSMADDEIKFGDNDILTKHFIKWLELGGAQRLIFVSKHALHDKNPDKYPDAKLISDIYSQEKRTIDTTGKTKGGTGGMGPKYDAGLELAKQGITTHILSAKPIKGAIYDVVVNKHKIGSRFRPRRKLWPRRYQPFALAA